MNLSLTYLAVNLMAPFCQRLVPLGLGMVNVWHGKTWLCKESGLEESYGRSKISSKAVGIFNVFQTL